MSAPVAVASALPRRQVFRLPRAQRMADILLIARQVFREKGYNDAVLAEIAEGAGVVEGTIYRYFTGKRDLLIKVVEHWYEEMLTDYDRQLEGIRGTWNRLRFMVWRHLTVIHNDPAMCRLVFSELRSDLDYRDTAVFELNREYTNRTLAIIQDAMDSGEFRTGVPLRVVRDMIYGGVEHHIWAYLRGEGDFSPEDSADAITDIVYRGLLRQGAAIDRGEQAVRRLEEVAARLEKAAGLDQNMETEMSRTTGKATC